MMTFYNSTETFMKSDKPSEIAVAAINHICTGRTLGEERSGNFIILSKFRTLSEIIVCLLLIVFFFLHNDIIGFLHPLFECDVYGLLFQCVVPNTKYLYCQPHHLPLSQHFFYQIFLCGSLPLPGGPIWILDLLRLQFYLDSTSKVIQPSGTFYQAAIICF